MQTLRFQLLLAFLVMSVITATLGAFSAYSIDREGELVDRTYDRSLMAVSFARAANADFFALLAAHARAHAVAGNASAAQAAARRIDELKRTMEDDLSVAVERAQSDRATQAAGRTLHALAAWSQAQLQMDKGGDAAWAVLDRQATTVNAELDLLVNYTAGDGFTYRQKAHATVRQNRRFNDLATAAALVSSGLIAWFLARRIRDPIKNASHIAGRIAGGDLDVAVPSSRSDELGDLLRSMEEMRRGIKASMGREIALRRSAQMRLANALEHSCDGVVVVDAERRIALANGQAADLLRAISSSVTVGCDARPLIASLSADPAAAAASEAAPAREIEGADGRWLRVSRNETHDGGSVIICSDISLIKSQQAALNTANFWLDAALSNLSHGLCLFDADGRLKVYNHRFCEILQLPEAYVAAGMRLDEVLALSLMDRDGDVKAVFEGQLKACVAAAKTVEHILRLPRDRQVSTSFRPLEGGGWLATFEDVTQRIETERKIAFMARHDALTALPNRLLFAERVELAITAAKRGSRFALLCLDLDRFKEVNDTLGHPTGDELLRQVAARIRTCLRETDTIARLGGDEFAIIQSHVNTADDVSVVATRILEVLRAPYQLGANKVSVSVSIGAALAPDDGVDYDRLLKNADLALYRAKGDGRNLLRFFQRGMDEALQLRRAIEQDLRDALAKGEFELLYQPIFTIAAPRFCGVEALLRWHHPTRGLVPPSDFIPILEEMGLIGRVGDHVLRTACTDAMAWPDDVSLAVNVSAMQFRGGDLLRRVVEVLYATGLPASRLELEITESVLIEDRQSTLVTLQQIRELGVKIALDDFGTGYSSLSYLRSFPFDRLKIDQSFTRDASPGSRAIIRTIVGLCASLDMRTTAEGIETREQLEAVMREGCDEAQGFYFSHPVPAERIAALLRQAPDAAAPRPAPKRLAS